MEYDSIHSGSTKKFVLPLLVLDLLKEKYNTVLMIGGNRKLFYKNFEHLNMNSILRKNKKKQGESLLYGLNIIIPETTV